MNAFTFLFLSSFVFQSAMAELKGFVQCDPSKSATNTAQLKGIMTQWYDENTHTLRGSFAPTLITLKEGQKTVHSFNQNPINPDRATLMIGELFSTDEDFPTYAGTLRFDLDREDPVKKIELNTDTGSISKVITENSEYSMNCSESLNQLVCSSSEITLSFRGIEVGSEVRTNLKKYDETRMISIESISINSSQLKASVQVDGYVGIFKVSATFDPMNKDGGYSGVIQHKGKSYPAECVRRF